MDVEKAVHLFSSKACFFFPHAMNAFARLKLMKASDHHVELIHKGRILFVSLVHL
jgi:hypothetical protein